MRHCVRGENLVGNGKDLVLTCEMSLSLYEAFRRNRVFRLVDAIPITPELGNCVFHTWPQAGA